MKLKCTNSTEDTDDVAQEEDSKRKEGGRGREKGVAFDYYDPIPLTKLVVFQIYLVSTVSRLTLTLYLTASSPFFTFNFSSFLRLLKFRPTKSRSFLPGE